MTHIRAITTLILSAATLTLAVDSSHDHHLRGLQHLDQPGKGGSGSGGGDGGGSKYAAEMLKAVNAECQKQGLSPYCYNDKLQKSAQAHSEDQAKNQKMSHSGSNGSQVADRIKAVGFKANTSTENCAAGQRDVAEAIKDWMNSDGHRRAILGPYKFFGMGYATNSGTAYWTQNFATSDSEKCSDGGNDKPGDGGKTPAPSPTSKPGDSKPSEGSRTPAPAPSSKPKPTSAPKPAPDEVPSIPDNGGGGMGPMPENGGVKPTPENGNGGWELMPDSGGVFPDSDLNDGGMWGHPDEHSITFASFPPSGNRA